MTRFAIKLLTNLKVSSETTVPSGAMFEGTVEELPDFIQTMVREKSTSIVIRELSVPEVDEVPDAPKPRKPSPRKPIKK